MKHLKLFFSFLLIILVSCISQYQGFQIDGEINNAPEGVKVYLINDHSGVTTDSTFIANNRFSFKGQIPYPQRFSIVYKGNTNDYNHFVWIENGVTKINGEWDQLENIYINGGYEQHIFKGMEAASSFFQPELNRLLKENKSDSIGSLINRSRKVLEDYSIKNCNSYAAVEQLYRVRNKINRDTLGIVIDKLTTEILNSPYGQSLLLHYKSPPLENGDPYKDFSATKLTGESLLLSQLLEKRKPILLIFGGLGCMQRNGRSLLKKFHEQYKDDIEILAFVFARNREEWIRDSKYQIGIPLISDIKGDHSPIKIQYGIQETPTVYLLDKNGKIVLKTLGYGESVNKVAKALFGK